MSSSRRISKSPPPVERGLSRSPPPVSRAARSQSPSLDAATAHASLVAFAERCKRFYFERDEDAGRSLDSTLEKLGSAERSAYSKVMASVRAAFHRKQEIERRQVAVRLLEETEPGSVVKKALSISEGGTTAMRSSAARLVRKEQLKSLLDQHCSPHLPGTHPFFRGLCALLLLQCEAAGKSGGAGKHRLEWEVDVAVFTEAGGRDWLKQTIVILVGVLGMQQHIKGEMSLAHPRHEDEVPDLDEPVSLRKKGEVPPRVPPHRVLRRQSEGDPFGDPAPARAPLTTALPLEPLEPSPEPQTRVFTMAPYITDPELASLATLFPDFITKAVKGHRLGHSAQEVTPSDLESGFNARASVISHDSDAASVRSRAFAKPGHGAIVLSRSTRDEGWHGGVVERLVWFLKRVLHMS